MVLEDIWSWFDGLLGSLSIEEGTMIIQPLIMFVIGMVLYAVFVFKFDRFIARRDIFRLSKGEATGAKKIVHALEYIFLFPILAFVWFFVISVLLGLLSQVFSIGNIFMVSMAILATIRISAYINENLSRDIAKLIPFALLAVFLLDILKVREAEAVAETVLLQIPGEMATIVYYFVFIVVLELLLRAIVVPLSRTNKPVKK